MKTFSQILEEHLSETPYSHTMVSPSAIYISGTLEPGCISSLKSVGFKINLRRPGNYKPTYSFEPVSYILSEMQSNAVIFFNHYLADYQKLKGHFSLERLKRCYRILARKFHPDHGGNSDLFRTLHAQYKILLDLLSPIK